MQEFKKKKDLEEMLVVHRPAGQEKDKVGREGDKGREGMQSAIELEQLKKRLLSAADLHEQEMLLKMIRGRFGNEAADKAIRERTFQQKK